MKVEVLKSFIFSVVIFSVTALALAGKSSFFFQEYFMAQSLGLFLLSSLLVFLLVKAELNKTVAMAAVLLGITLYYFFSYFKINLFHLKYFNFILCSISMFTLGHLDSKVRLKLSEAIVVIALIQSAVAILSFIFMPQFIFNREAIGTVGNSDFLSSLFVAALFLIQEFKYPNKYKFFFSALLFAGILATFSKGSLILVILIFAFHKWPRKTISLVFLGLSLAAFFFMNSFKGRIQIWISALHLMRQHLWTGVGVGQFGSGYFNSNLELMSNPNYKHYFGAWSSEVSDAHNLLLQFGSELGLLGVGFTLIFYFYAYNRFKTNQLASKRYIFFGFIKSLYTVVLPSIQNSFLLMTSLASNRVHEERNNYSKLLISASVCFLSFYSGILCSYSFGQYYLKKGLNESLKGLWSQSLMSFEKSSKFNPTDYESRLALAYVQMKLNDCDGAELSVSDVITLRQSIDSYKRGGHILYECKKYENALRLFSDLHVAFPEHRTTTMKMAWIFYFLHDNISAKSLAEEVLKITPRRISTSDERNLRDARELLKLVSLSGQRSL